MNPKGNCRVFGPNANDCPYLEYLVKKKGKVQKQGPATWFKCKLVGKSIVHVKSCGLAGKSKLYRRNFKIKKGACDE